MTPVTRGCKGRVKSSPGGPIFSLHPFPSHPNAQQSERGNPLGRGDFPRPSCSPLSPRSTTALTAPPGQGGTVPQAGRKRSFTTPHLSARLLRTEEIEGLPRSSPSAPAGRELCGLPSAALPSSAVRVPPKGKDSRSHTGTHRSYSQMPATSPGARITCK